jgi:hypothetical protein
MADGTIASLRASEVQTYWDADQRRPYVKLYYRPNLGVWQFGMFTFREDPDETTPTKVGSAPAKDNTATH